MVQSLFIPAREFDGIDVVVGIFWKVFELKKLLLSAWKIDRWLSCIWDPLCNPGGGGWLAPCDEFVLAGDEPTDDTQKSLYYTTWSKSFLYSYNARINSYSIQFSSREITYIHVT